VVHQKSAGRNKSSLEAFCYSRILLQYVSQSAEEMMPTYLTPGVYINEVSSGSRPIEAVETSVAAFIGVTQRGPVYSPVSITGQYEFERIFGGFLPPGSGMETNPAGDTCHRSYLAHAVCHFFNNGGRRCYVVRICKDDASSATSSNIGLLTDVKAAYRAADTISPADARNPGQWANDHYDVHITPSQRDPVHLFNLAIRYWKTAEDRSLPEDQWRDDPIIKESYSDLSHWPGSRAFAPDVVNRASNLLSIEIDSSRIAACATDEHNLAAAETYVLASGNDGSELNPLTDGYIFDEALHSLDSIGDVQLIAIPGIHEQARKGVEYCENRPQNDCIFFMDPPEDKDSPSEILSWLNQPKNYTSSSYGVLYYPWVKAANLAREGGTDWFPPSGFVMGIYARIDTARGVWKAPAGRTASLTGAIDVKTHLTHRQQAGLNPRGINCLRVFKGMGTMVWGSRTLATGVDPEWRYVPLRRTAIMIERSIYCGIQWAIFEPNDHRLWSFLRINIENFLLGLFRAGAFQGSTAKDAYFVRCGLGDTMSQGDIDAGRVIVELGFAPLKPAEFMIIRIKQKVNRG
jgi:phage tail sheath protein FI